MICSSTRRNEQLASTEKKMTTAEPIYLGPFQLGSSIGRGGMGEVFSATHQDTGARAAVKFVLTTRQEALHADFQRELQAHASLVHPGIVYLFEYGIIHSDTAEASQGLLKAGAPYVVMELAKGGSYHESMATSWNEVRHVLLQVLDALAFAHARGVIHRDIKPENWLVFQGASKNLRIKLADFGLAHAYSQIPDRSEEDLSNVSGTSYYMAPEQILAEWRSFGPWTDLYSLGCVAWHLICGQPPYRGDSLYTIAMKHIDGEIPPFAPRFAVPSEVEGWLRRLMAREVSHRFQRAADAAFALPADDDRTPLRARRATNTGPIRAIWAPDMVAMPTLGQAGTLELWKEEGYRSPEEATEQLFFDEPEPIDALASTAPLRTDEEDQFLASRAASGRSPQNRPNRSDFGAPPIPFTWRAPDPESLPAHLIGTGLGLFGLREVPFVGREEERDQIWRAIKAAIGGTSWRVIFLVGESGTGKSRLAQWVATRTHEVGAVELLQTRHSPGGAPGRDGLPGLLQRWLHSWNLSTEEIEAALLEALVELSYDETLETLETQEKSTNQKSLLESDARILATWLRPRANQVPPKELRFAALVRLLERIHRQRTPLLWLDDLHLGRESMEWISYLLENSPTSGAGVILATLRSDLLQDQPGLEEELKALLKRDPRCLSLSLQALDGEDHRALLARMLPLADELREELAQRTEGNPLFASQLLSHYINTGAIASGPRGFEIPAGKTLELPEDIHQLWESRVSRLLSSLSPDRQDQARAALEAAACLGRTISPEDWLFLDEGSNGASRELLDLLLEDGLARRHQEGWTFVHGLLQESLLKMAAQGGRLQDHNGRCAELLEIQYARNFPPVAYRCGLHWAKAQKPRRALRAMIRSFDWLYPRGELLPCLRACDSLLTRVATGHIQDLALEVEFMWVRHIYFDGNNDEALRRTRTLVETAESLGLQDFLLRAQHFLACLLIIRDLHEAQQLLRKCILLAESLGNRLELGRNTYRLGRTFCDRGDLDEARALYKKSLDHYGAADASPFDILWVEAELAWLEVKSDHLPEARELFLPILERAQKEGYRIVENHCLDGLGDTARYLGDLDAAQAYFSASLSNALEIGDGQAELNARLNLLFVLLAREANPEATVALQQLRSLNEATGQGQYDEALDVTEMALLARQGRFDDLDALLLSYQGGWPSHRPVWREHAEYLREADDLARQAGALRPLLGVLCREVERRLGGEG